MEIKRPLFLEWSFRKYEIRNVLISIIKNIVMLITIIGIFNSSSTLPSIIPNNMPTKVIDSILIFFL